MRKETGLIHVYCGDGKGKTTAGMGLILRAAGYGYKVLLYQFMKDNKGNERNILKNIENITIVDGMEQEKFSFQMRPEEKQEHREFYMRQFQIITQKAVDEEYDVLFMDEIIYAVSSGLLDESAVLDFLKRKPENLEVILTGNIPGEAMIEAADYVSEIQKRKHPFDKGQRARGGIEK